MLASFIKDHRYKWINQSNIPKVIEGFYWYVTSQSRSLVLEALISCNYVRDFINSTSTILPWFTVMSNSYSIYNLMFYVLSSMLQKAFWPSTCNRIWPQRERNLPDSFNTAVSFACHQVLSPSIRSLGPMRCDRKGLSRLHLIPWKCHFGSAGCFVFTISRFEDWLDKR